MTGRAYLDHNATSPMRPEVAASMREAMGRFGNPSSVHAEGRAARAAIEDAREQVAQLVRADAADVVFTSGGTEANNLALQPSSLSLRGGATLSRLIMTAGEHPSVLDGHGFPADAAARVAIRRDGRVDLDDLSRLLASDGQRPALVSVQVANSETGVLQPLPEITVLVGDLGVVHADAVQAAGRIPLDIAALGVGALTLSGHKLGGPMGAGALVLAPGREGLGEGPGKGPGLRLVRGGGQERGRRGGTENVPAIVGFGAAAAIALRELDEVAYRVRALRDRAEAEIRRIAPAAMIFGERAERLPNTVAFAVPGLGADMALIALDLDGVAVSSGSACSSGKVGRSHVLAAMGIAADIAAGAIRLSFGWNSSQEDVMRFVHSFEKLVGRLYEGRRARAA